MAIFQNEKTYFFLETPEGRGAIAVISVWGRGAKTTVETFFTPKLTENWKNSVPGKVVYGEIQAEDVLVCPTGQGGVEIHCHGSMAAVRRIMNLLQLAGAEAMDSEHFGELQGWTPVQRRVMEWLPYATTWKTTRILWEQFHGALERAWEKGEDTQRWQGIADHLIQPWKVVLAGRPNVGKSSLFNAILGFARAIVHTEAGTTRDVLSERTVLEGWNVEFFDSAGLHATENPVEQVGIRRAQQEIQEADLVLWIRDVTAGVDEEKFPLKTSGKLLTVWNKRDEAKPPYPTLSVSAKTGEGIPQLLKTIVRTLIPQEPPPGTGIPILPCEKDRPSNI
ncbi:MAG: 50S ribosome-binding GTPase [Planctomycetia bacterium]|nr:50S ribosome-binding GTPase [Planctomycetia bacterium]